MIIRVDDYLEIPVAREEIEPDHIYYHDKVECMAGNTKIIQDGTMGQIKQHRWDMVTESLTYEQAVSTANILAGLGDYWPMTGDWFSGKGQFPRFETDEEDPDEPIIVTGAYGDAIRLNDYDMYLDVYLEVELLVSFYRQDTAIDDRFFHYLVDCWADDIEKVWINGELADEDEIEEHELRDWFDYDIYDNYIHFDNTAGDLDSIFIMPGVVYDEDLFSAQDIYEAGELPVNAGVFEVEGDFLDEEDSILCTCELDESQFENIGQSVEVSFTLEEDI